MVHFHFLFAHLLGDKQHGGLEETSTVSIARPDDQGRPDNHMPGPDDEARPDSAGMLYFKIVICIPNF